MAVINPQAGAVSVLMNYSDNPWFPATLESERIHAQKTMRPADYAHVWEGQCKPAVEGAIYADEVAAVQEQGRFCRVHYDPLLKAHTVWDLGFNDSMSIILVQRAASELRVIDYIEDNRLPLPDYVARLQAMGLNWGNDWLPHDGFAKRHQTGKSDDEVLKALGRDVLQVPGSEVENGIRQARIVFPRIWFNSESKGVQVLMEHLKRYRRHVSRTTGEASRPLHDAHSHGADAFRYLALVADQLSNSVRKVPRQSSVQAVVGWMG
jgi:phage terminase large subunit